MVTIIACRASAFIRDPANGVGPAILLHVGVASLVVCALNFTIGYWIGEKNWRGESSQTLGQKNTGAMIVFASLYAGPLVALGPTTYVLWHNLWNAAQLARASAGGRKETESSKTSTTDAQ
jgi:BASS family bile acid:Na+ symporter